MPPPDAPDEVHRAFHATAIGNIRIVTSTLNLNDNTKYCTREGDVVPNFKGGTVVCAAEDIFTDEKRDILLNKVLPAAIGMLSGALKVNRVQGRLLSRGCQYYTRPGSYTLVSYADYVLYVSAAPTVGTTRAWGGLCNYDELGRPVEGRANFGPKFIVWEDNVKDDQQRIVRTAAHEILHALGFLKKVWKNASSFLAGNPIATKIRRGKKVLYFKSSKVVEKAREQFNCPSLKGPELEDEGGGGSGSSHWERRNHMDDIMSGISGTRYLTPITLAVMEDSGHYTIDWSKAENPKWMYKAG
eukprot:Tbor_TRINITY_DN6064_c1_g1::TRINITY_DN6064_c1_g1_i14::g.10475::m.10475